MTFSRFSYKVKKKNPDVFFKKGVSTNFAKIVGKSLYRNPICISIKKQTPSQVFPVYVAKFVFNLRQPMLLKRNFTEILFLENDPEVFNT